MNLHAWLAQFSPAERQRFAEAIGTSRSYLTLVGGNYKQISLGLACAIVGGSNNEVTFDVLPLTPTAREQLALFRGENKVELPQPGRRRYQRVGRKTKRD